MQLLYLLFFKSEIRLKKHLCWMTEISWDMNCYYIIVCSSCDLSEDHLVRSECTWRSRFERMTLEYFPLRNTKEYINDKPLARCSTGGCTWYLYDFASVCIQSGRISIRKCSIYIFGVLKKKLNILYKFIILLHYYWIIRSFQRIPTKVAKHWSVPTGAYITINATSTVEFNG